jgi:hypothetical protein
VAELGSEESRGAGCLGKSFFVKSGVVDRGRGRVSLVASRFEAEDGGVMGDAKVGDLDVIVVFRPEEVGGV